MSDCRRSVCLAAAAFSILAAPFAIAQETTSQLTGYVVGADGQPIPGITVRIVHVPSGTTDSATTNASGQFSATGLRVGGPYRVSVQAEGMQEAVVEDLHTQLSERNSVTLVVLPIAQLTGIEVTGAAARDVTIGAATRFGPRDIREMPSISRDIKDVVRIDPKAWVDPTNSDAMEIAGVNARYNTITVDGVRQSDDFGLNANGYPTQRSPLSVDAIEAVSALTAPFSVEYSFFRGSTINIVTKSGTNAVQGFRLLLQGRRQPARRPYPGHGRQSRVRRGHLRRHDRRPDREGQAVLLPVLREARPEGAAGHRRHRLRDFRSRSPA